MAFKQYLFLFYLINIIITQTSDENQKEEEEQKEENVSFEKNCLDKNENNTKVSINECMGNSDKIYCCLLTITYKNGLELKKCLTTDYDEEKINERIELFEKQLNVKDVSIDCSANYLIINTLILILLINFL